MPKRHLITIGVVAATIIFAPFAHSEQISPNLTTTPRPIAKVMKVVEPAPQRHPRLAEQFPGHSRRFYHRLHVFLKARERAVKRARLLTALQPYFEAIYVPYHTGTVNGYACGGNLPPCCVLFRESKGNPYAVNPGHMGEPYGDPGDPWTHASGLYQDMPATWARYRNFPYAAAAPVGVQYRKNEILYDRGNGIGHWGGGC